MTKAPQAISLRLEDSNAIKDHMPAMQGWRILVAPYVAPEKTHGGIIRPDQTREGDTHAATCAQDLAMGPLCFTRKDHGDTPWCSIGDWVIMQKWGGKRMSIMGVECRVINDDEVLGVVESPEPYYT